MLPMCRMPMVRHHWISFDYPNQLNIGFCRPTCLSFVLFRGLISTSALDSYMKFPPVCPILPRLLNAYYSDWCSCEPGLFSWAFRQSWRSKKIRFLDQNASKHHTKTSQANVDWWKSAHGISETPMETHHFQVPDKTSENSLVSSAGSPMGKMMGFGMFYPGKLGCWTCKVTQF